MRRARDSAPCLQTLLGRARPLARRRAAPGSFETRGNIKDSRAGFAPQAERTFEIVGANAPSWNDMRSNVP